MSRTIGDDAIKISLMQTLPGEEFNVAAALEQACIKAGLSNFAIFKGFGSYDIIFIHGWHDFSSVLTEFGPIPGILKTTKSFCYHHTAGSSENFFNKVKNYACAAITIIKISNDQGLCCYTSERAIVDEMAETYGGPTFFFGTLGWSEVIAITVGDELSDIVRRCLVPSYSKTSKYIQKTFSILALNYKCLPYQEQNYSLETLVSLVPSLNAQIDDDVTPIISITCFPGANEELISFWPKEYEIYDLVGKEDIQVVPARNIRWVDLIFQLFSFRNKFKNLIHSTTTYVSYHGYVDRKNINISISDPPPFNYDFEAVIKVFGDRGLSLASALNTLKGLIRNKIVCDAFWDMSLYHEYILEFAPFIEPHRRDNFASQVTETINKSAETRLYGTYGTIEENVGQFNKLRGGVQRSLQAVSFLPTVALARTLGKFEYQWKGFTSVSSNQFYNSNEVIHVPIDSLWKPDTWWAVNHEVAHIIINNVIFEDGSGIVDDKNIELKMFLASKNNPDHWLQLVTELTAEYIGYELGFYSNYDLFLKKIWNYLKELAPKNLLYSPLSIYAVRTYFVRLFEKVFVSNEMEISNASNYDLIYEEIAANIDDIARIIGTSPSEQFKAFFDDKFIIAAYYAPKFKSLLPWMENVLKPAIEEIKCRQSDHELYDSNTNEILSSLEAGIVWDSEIKYPEAVMYKIYQKEKVSFRTSIATVLTLWNQSKKMRLQ